jgi:dolichol-phosphate mannosyltransferase
MSGAAGPVLSRPRLSECLIVTATYNEVGNIGPLLDALFSLTPACDVLVIDDSSKDGTTAVLAARAATEPRLHVIVRPGKLGIGSAHKLGWLYARRHGYSRLATMDADMSHNPADVPRLLAAIDAGADAAFGSRFIAGGRLNYTGWRLFLSRNANRFARLLLRLPLAEYTTSLRAARLDRVPEGLVECIESDGYSFFMASACEISRAGLRVCEIPIHFRDRHEGHSKIPKSQIFRGAFNLLRLATKRRSVIKPSQHLGGTCERCHLPYHVRAKSGRTCCLICLGQA